MSFWFWARNKEGKWQLTAVGVPWNMLPAVLVLSISILAAIAAVETSAAFFLVPLGLGFALFLIARLSVMRKRALLAFGPSGMSVRMKACYWIGYALMGLAASLIILRWHSTIAPPYPR